jgi:hypothetical protein
MLYSSWAFNRGGTNKNDAVMRKRSDDSIFGNFWFVNNLISDGDGKYDQRYYGIPWCQLSAKGYSCGGEANLS